MGSICNKSPEVIETIINPDYMLPFAYHYDLRKKYNFIKIINHGAFGQVKLFSDKTFTNVQLAIKTISKELLTKKNKFQQIKKEIEILSELDHPNIVIYYTTVEMPENFNVLMEYLSGNDLHQIIRKKKKKITPEQFKYMLYQILSALCYLHQNEIVHRDIKPENIICTSNETINGKYDLKLIDFGLSERFKKKENYSSAGSPHYMSPEALSGKITPKNDIWSVGIIFYIYCFGKLPFDSVNRKELFRQIREDDINFDIKRKEDITDDEIDLLKKMLDKDYETRINALNAIRHPVFNHLNVEFDSDNMNHYFEEFFSQNTLKLITMYVECSIIKKTFLYIYVLLNPFEKRHYYRKMFLAIDNYFNYIGVLKSREVFEEFKKRKLVDDEAGEIFSFIDCNRTNNAKKLYKKEGSSRGDVSSESSKKELSRTATSKSLKFKDWGQITYTVFLSFFFIDELPKLVDDENKISYLFKFFCDRPLNFDLDKKYSIIDNEGETIYTDGMDHRSNTITKDTFKRFLFKHNLPFKDAEDDINKFFTEHPNPIYYKEFKELILKNDSD